MSRKALLFYYYYFGWDLPVFTHKLKRYTCVHAPTFLYIDIL